MGQSIQANQIIKHLYIHFPYCLKKCGYCSFYSVPYNFESVEEYAGHLMMELERFNQLYSIVPETIYFGGGTPSLLSPDLLQVMINLFPKPSKQEITIEVNPSTITQEYLWKLKETDVNRISMGVQSFNDDVLTFLGRTHTSEVVREAYKLLRKTNYNNISLDLIYGTPGQNLDDVAKDVEEMIRLNPEHISTYCLSLEDDVPLATEIGNIGTDEDVHEMYYLISRMLRKNGYKHYEISNFAKSRLESKHNTAYWRLADYLGAGASASGLVGNIHYMNPPDIQEYFKVVVKGQQFPGREILSKKALQSEFIIMSLRTAQGIKLRDFYELFGHDFEKIYSQQLRKMDKYLTKNNGRIKLKRGFWFVSNSILEEFVE
ncbi:MAG: radical SAM family heme chaperone HemW [Candidatus Cloacimonetes bacterium]|nr:radical SAM family heme chaperone HemW [Candidatus Cloacimonadota bacterium]